MSKAEAKVYPTKNQADSKKEEELIEYFENIGYPALAKFISHGQNKISQQH